jgi:hypothetical protein
MGLNKYVERFIESKRMNDLNCSLLYFPDENCKQIKSRWNEIIEILNQSKSFERHESKVISNIDILEMSYEESVSYFKRL